jgi:hypothetical protein
MITLHALEEVIRESWCAETSIYSDWTHGAYGQCTPTALTIQDYMGGEIGYVNVYIKGNYVDKHFSNVFNRIVYDFTYTQFEQILVKHGAIYSDIHFSEYNYVTREKLLRIPHVKNKYTLLKGLVNYEINNKYT